MNGIGMGVGLWSDVEVVKPPNIDSVSSFVHFLGGLLGLLWPKPPVGSAIFSRLLELFQNLDLGIPVTRPQFWPS